MTSESLREGQGMVEPIGCLQMDSDVVVVGAGLAGLTAAVRVAQAGYKVLVLERLPVAGGLCGHWTCDGRTFVRACNEFGGHLPKTLEALGVNVSFRSSRSQIFLGNEHLTLPPNLPTIARLTRRVSGLLRLIRAGRHIESASLAELIDVSDAGSVSDLVGVLASLAGVPLQFMRLEDTREVAGTYKGFGWSSPVKPVGGPQAVVDALEKRLLSLGGRLLTSTEVLEVKRLEQGFAVMTAANVVRARQVISSEPRWSEYPADAATGLSLGQILLAVRPGLPFPDDVQTVYHVPTGVRTWMDVLASGRTPSDFGFSVARGFLPPQPDHETLVSFFALPLGEEELTPARRDALLRYVLHHGERMLPGLNASILYQRVISPAEFRSIHGISSAPLPRLPRGAYRRPDNLDSSTGIFHVGVSVPPPGNDGNAAVVSGWLVADRVIRQMRG